MAKLKQTIKVNIIYRNYKPLHSIFTSYISCPPEGYIFYAPKGKKHSSAYALLFRLYGMVGDFRIVKWAVVGIVDRLLFKPSTPAPDVVISHYLNMVPNRDMKRPYVVEMEHISLVCGLGPSKKRLDAVRHSLSNEWCRAIICSSHAAEGTLKYLFGDNYQSIKNKVNVVYPGISPGDALNKYKPRAKSGRLNILFVGNLSYAKGLEEVLMALKAVPVSKNKVKLTIISNDAHKLVNRYPDLAEIIDVYQPSFSKKEILENFYSKADVFLMPTKRDTFGFAIIDAMACGTPVVASNQFAIPEIIDDQKDGILLQLDNPVLNETIFMDRKKSNADLISNPNQLLVSELKKLFIGLCGDSFQLEVMGKKGMSKVQPGGKFSVKARNVQLKKIYDKVVNDLDL